MCNHLYLRLHCIIFCYESGTLCRIWEPFVAYRDFDAGSFCRDKRPFDAGTYWGGTFCRSWGPFDAGTFCHSTVQIPSHGKSRGWNPDPKLPISVGCRHAHAIQIILAQTANIKILHFKLNSVPNICLWMKTTTISTKNNLFKWFPRCNTQKPKQI